MDSLGQAASVPNCLGPMGSPDLGLGCQSPSLYCCLDLVVRWDGVMLGIFLHDATEGNWGQWHEPILSQAG